MESQNLVIDHTVEELEAARAEKESQPERTTARQRAEVTPLPPEEKRGEAQQGGRKKVKKAVRSDPPIVGAVNVKVVPLEQLMKQNLVGSSHQADAQNTSDKASGAVSGLVVRSAPFQTGSPPYFTLRFRTDANSVLSEVNRVCGTTENRGRSSPVTRRTYR